MEDGRKEAQKGFAKMTVRESCRPPFLAPFLSAPPRARFARSDILTPTEISFCAFCAFLRLLSPPAYIYQ